MHSGIKRLGMPSIEGQAVLVGASLFALATGMAQWAADVPAWRIESPVEYASDVAVAVGFCWTLFQLAVHWHARRDRHRWLLALGAMAALGAVEATDLLVSSGAIGDDWLIDLPLWLVATTLMRAVVRRGRERPWVLALWRVGLLFQTVFILCDLGEGRQLQAWTLSMRDLASLAEWSELLAIESYVVALVFLGRADLSPASPRRAMSSAVGTEARRVYEKADLFRKAIYPPLRVAFVPGLRAALLAATSLSLVATLGVTVRRAGGRSLTGQLCDLLFLGLRHGFDPLAYYFQELFLPGRRAQADGYLTRHETKNGLMQALNALKPSPDGANEMKDKVLFARRCGSLALPVPETLMVCDAHGARWHATRDAFDRDLFLKPCSGRGARGVNTLERVEQLHFRAADGTLIGLDALVMQSNSRGRKTPMIVQPRLYNHAELADLAERSLITVRVLTCLDAQGQPVATHGLLRILSKLEPSWKRKDEYGAPIDLATGRLGMLRSDRLANCTRSYDHHPVTGRRVEGRVLATWPAVQALALAAHRAFPHRILVGWDIASTDGGPVLLEGNINLDVMFPQRVHRQGFADSPLGPLLRHHLAQLAQAYDVD